MIVVYAIHLASREGHGMSGIAYLGLGIIASLVLGFLVPLAASGYPLPLIAFDVFVAIWLLYYIPAPEDNWQGWLAMLVLCLASVVSGLALRRRTRMAAALNRAIIAYLGGGLGASQHDPGPVLQAFGIDRGERLVEEIERLLGAVRGPEPAEDSRGTVDGDWPAKRKQLLAGDPDLDGAALHALGREYTTGPSSTGIANRIR